MMGAEVQETGEPLSSAVAGEPDWDLVFAQELPRVYNFLRYRLGDEGLAEDVTSRTFEKAWRERRRYKRSASPAAPSCWVKHLRTGSWSPDTS